ncbi:MAG: hybrid sensor histidine kinase/response regulator [Deltaproteobacteria bacterium]
MAAPRPPGGTGRGSRDDLASRLQDLELLRARDARALSDLGGSVGLPLATALKRHLAVVSRIFGARTSFILLFDPITGQLSVASVRGRTDPWVAAAVPGEGPFGDAYASGKIVLSWAAALDRRRGGRVRLDDPLLALAAARRRSATRATPTGPGKESRRLVAVPMLATGRCLGVLGMIQPVFERGDAPGEAESDLLLALGAQAAAAVEIARLRDDALRRSRDLETALAGTRSLARNRDEALGTISHELRTPLSTVKSYLALLAQGEQLGQLTKGQRDVVEVCQRNVERIQRLIHDLVLTSRLQAGRMELDPKPIGLRALISEALLTCAPFASEQGVRVELVPGHEAFIRGNRDRLTDALLNVLDNAIRYNRRGGRVSVTAGSQGAVARILVEDDGQGIAKDDLAHVFERFIELDISPTGNGIGVGLGLAIVRQVVDRHGGRIALTSELGQGTQAVIDLPLFAGVASGLSAAPDEAQGPEHGDGTILLVEDDADCRMALQLVLQQEGYEVDVVAGGKDAVASLAQKRPSLMLLDLHMPDLDGRLLLRQIRKQEALKNLPVFVISGAIEAAAGIDRLAPGEDVAGVFEKPLNFPRLLESIAGQLGRRPKA